MNKNIYYVLLLSLYISASTWAQTHKSFITNWEPTVIEHANESLDSRRLTAQSVQNNTIRPSAYHRLNREHIEVNEVWKDESTVDPNSVKLENIRYEPLNAMELNKLNKASVHNKITYSLASSKGRNQLYTTLTYSPV